MGYTFWTVPPSALARARTSFFATLRDAVEAAEDDQRQDDSAVLRLLVVAAEQVGDAQIKPAWLFGVAWLAATLPSVKRVPPVA
jgi:hypothetical protein